MGLGYKPYGEEWASEVKKGPKSFIVDLLRNACVARDIAEDSLAAETKRREEAEDLCRRLRESLDNTAEEHDALRADNARLREIVARYMTASGDVAALDADAAELLGPGGVTAAIAPKGKGGAS